MSNENSGLRDFIPVFIKMKMLFPADGQDAALRIAVQFGQVKCQQ